MNWKKIKYGTIILIIVFAAGGLWSPIIYSQELDLTSFIMGGTYTILVLLGGGALFRWAMKTSLKKADSE